MILITGPTGSGKTTTLYAGLHAINSPAINIVTAEDPVEYNLKGVNQVQINEAMGRTFADHPAIVLASGPRRHSRRRDPRSGDRTDRGACRVDRAPRPVHVAHQRLPLDHHAPRGHGDHRRISSPRRCCSSWRSALPAGSAKGARRPSRSARTSWLPTAMYRPARGQVRRRAWQGLCSGAISRA